MPKTRVIPCLLLRDGGLVKTVRFKSPTYIGDPINAVRIFNDKEVDELIFLDIDASRAQRPPDFQLISEIASECFMPLTYGGGISHIDHISRLMHMGVDKVSLNTAAFADPNLVTEAARRFGSQSIIAAIDVKKGLFGKLQACSLNGSKKSGLSPAGAASMLAGRGAGELLINSVDRDGTGAGYDVPTLAAISASVEVPIVALGGAGSLGDFRAAVDEGHADAVAAGSLFVFHGKHRAVLISYPSISELDATLH